MTMQPGFRITEIWAWVSLDAGDDCEGILGHMTSLGMAPMIGADRERIESLRPEAEVIAAVLPNPVQLRRFSNMTIEETL